jgi:hypothetical protein
VINIELYSIRGFYIPAVIQFSFCDVKDRLGAGSQVVGWG